MLASEQRLPPSRPSAYGPLPGPLTRRPAPRSQRSGLEDTVDVRPYEVVEILARFDGYHGRYMLHCHVVSPPLSRTDLQIGALATAGCEVRPGSERPRLRLPRRDHRRQQG
ncbi:multicopper oxidase domain-containing protein [Streptomyces sp. SID1328]|uniref:multicopper oxidase domain-containing protein n=1 Tax=Streptomyces sp. SID1328 TaxID=2690250 RepID=UPI0031F905B0